MHKAIGSGGSPGFSALLLFALILPAAAHAHGPLETRIAALGRRIAEDPGDAELLLRRGELHRRQRSWALALADLDRAAELDRDHSEIVLLRGKTLLDAGRAADADAAFERYLAILPDDPAVSDPAVSDPAVSDPAVSDSAVSDSAVSDPALRDRRGSALILRGHANRRLGRPLAAAAHYRGAVDLAAKPGPQAFLDCARAYEAAGNAYLDAALGCLEDGLERLGPVVSLERYAIELGAGKRPREAAQEPGAARRIQAPAVAGTGGSDRVPTAGVSVLRGPYLQLATPESLVVRWRTDLPVDSLVSFGDAPDNLTELAFEPELVTDHEVELLGLLPETTYFYSIGTAEEVLAGADPETFFLTPPVAGIARPTRIWVIGDSGTGNDDARAVRDAYLAFNGNQHTDLWLMLGDNAYNEGTDEEYQTAVFETYPGLLRRSAVWPTLGNHDGISADSATQTGPYYDIFTLPTRGEAGGFPSGTEAYYAFDHANIHLIVLESHETDRSPGSAMLSWLAADLESTTADWVIAFWHHPPYSKGSHDSDAEFQLIEMRENVLPILENGGVDLVLAGHSHAYERSFLLDSHYGDSASLSDANILDAGDGNPLSGGPYRKQTLGPAPHEGAVYMVAGSSGRLGGGPLDHPAMFISLNLLGSVVLDVDGGMLNALFLDSTGAIGDRVTLVKADGDVIFSDGFESGDRSAWAGPVVEPVTWP